MTMAVVSAPRRYARLAVSDAASIVRDPMLLVAVGFSIATPLLLIGLRDPIDAAALSAFGVVDFWRYLLPLVLTIPALLIGWVSGFLMLEDRDDGPLIAIDVTPAGKLGFFTYRIVATALLSGGIALVALLANAPETSPAIGIVVALSVAATAVACAAILPVLARNKVEGMALSKLTNLMAVVPYAALLPFPFRYAAGVVPSFWIGELLVAPADGLPAWLSAIIAIGIGAVVVALLLRRLSRSVG